jgi:hypothetical protein
LGCGGFRRAPDCFREGWFSETDLYNRVRQLFPTMTVTHHGQTKWLGRQHFDIWMPDIGVAIEYQGEQHFREVTFFGGAEGLKNTRLRDQKKRDLCSQHGVRLIEVLFNDELSDEWLLRTIQGA